jgi:hypothetical protein
MSSTEYELLKEDIRVNGVVYPIIVDEEGTIIDGHHRAQICQELGIDCPVTVHKFSSVEERQAAALGLNMNRRHLSPEQMYLMRVRMQELVQTLRNQGKTQHDVAQLTGIPRGTIARWEASGAIEADDLRTLVPKGRYGEILARWETESADTIAADFKVTPARIRQIVDSMNKAVTTVETHTYKEQYGVIVMCKDEAEQEALYTEFHHRGLNCRVVVT